MGGNLTRCVRIQTFPSPMLSRFMRFCSKCSIAEYARRTCYERRRPRDQVLVPWIFALLCQRANTGPKEVREKLPSCARR